MEGLQVIAWIGFLLSIGTLLAEWTFSEQGKPTKMYDGVTQKKITLSLVAVSGVLFLMVILFL